MASKQVDTTQTEAYEKPLDSATAATSITDAHVVGTDLAHLQPGYYRSRLFLGSFAALSLGIFGGVAAFAFPAPLLGVINDDIGPSSSYVWISYVYNTSLAVTFPILGRLSDIAGRRYFFVGGAVLATVGSIICATSQSIPVLIGGNVFLGVASATQLSYHFVLGELVPIKYRYTATAILYIFAVPGGGFGPVIAESFLVYHPSVSWRGLYYVLIGVNALALLFWTLFYFPPDFKEKHGNDSKLHWLKHFDYVGLVLFMGGLVVFLFGISSGGSQWPWESAPPLVMIIIGFLSLVAFGLWERFANIKEPLAPRRIFKLQWLACGLTLGFASSIYYTTAIVWPQQVAVLYSDGNKIRSGFMACIPGLANEASLILGGPLVNLIGHHKYQTMASLFLAGMFMACCSLVSVNNENLLIGLVFCANFCSGWVEIINLSNSTIVIEDQRDIGVAGGLAASLRTGIAAVSTVVYVTTLTNQLTKNIPRLVGAAVVKAGLPPSSIPGFLMAINLGTATAFADVPGVSTEIIAAGGAAYKVASAESYRVLYLVSIAFSAIGFVVTWFTPNTETLQTTQVAATLHTHEVPNEEKKAGLEA